MPLANTAPPPDLQALLSDQGRAALVAKVDESSSPRLKALRDAAMTYGIQGGLAHRTFEINAIERTRTQQLDAIYNFNALMLDDNVVPPVLTESSASAKISGGDVIRLSDATYSIVMQAHFASSAPNWRDYLRPGQVYEAKLPDGAILPKNSDETAMWKSAVAEGWTVGVRQADQVFSQELSRLDRDYKGMVLYKRLLAEHMVSKPYVGKAELGITGNGSSMAINDRVLRITATPQLNSRASAWQPLVQPGSASSTTDSPSPASTDTPADDSGGAQTFPMQGSDSSQPAAQGSPR
jgi:defect-in-organelle-trafficking protein DotC